MATAAFGTPWGRMRGAATRRWILSGRTALGGVVASGGGVGAARHDRLGGHLMRLPVDRLALALELAAHALLHLGQARDDGAEAILGDAGQWGTPLARAPRAERSRAHGWPRLIIY